MQLAVRIVALAARLLLALGVVCLLLGAYLAWQSMSFSQKAVATTGTVVSYFEHDVDGKKRYRPRVRFVTGDGGIYSVPGQMDYASQRIPVGTVVPVQYQPADPNKIRIATFFDNWLGAAIAAGVGLVSMAGGVLVRRSTKRAR
ncbi:MAG TPA: DUF3592 domain-containing protein [Steroidobacteraceae bacterium]|nr:DUF3592 domain-containing protein [Steroidobacteraceae bacterium]